MAYAYYTAIDALAAAVGANEADFPCALVVTAARFATVANGGHVQGTALGGASGTLTVPADFVVSPNADGSSPYDFEIVDYDATTGYIELWVKITALDSAADTTVYLVYGDAAVVASQEDVAGTWSDDFHAVYHYAGQGAANVALDTYYGITNETLCSSENGGLIAEHVIDGRWNLEWASNGDGAAAWIQVNFDQAVTLSRIVLRDRAGVDNWGDGQIEFSDATTQAFTGLPVNGDPLNIVVSPAKVTTSIKITITGGGAGANRGLMAVEAYDNSEVGIEDSVGGFHVFKQNSGEPAGVAGQIGAGLDFAASDFLKVWDMDDLTVPVTLEMWVNPDLVAARGVFDSGPSLSNSVRNFSNDQFNWGMTFNLGWAALTWQKFTFVLSYSAPNRVVDWYKNGAFQAQVTAAGTNAIARMNDFIWGNVNFGAAGWYSGLLDEFVISDGARDSDWIGTRFENQDSPSPGGTFWSALGAEQEGGNGAAPPAACAGSFLHIGSRRGIHPIRIRDMMWRRCGAGTGPSGDALLLESGDYVLLETGDYTLLE